MLVVLQSDVTSCSCVQDNVSEDICKHEQ